MLVSIHLGATPVLFGASFGFCRGIPGCSQKPLGLHRDCQNDCSRNFAQGSGGLFHPEELVSKQAFLSMVCRASGLDDRSLESGANWSAPQLPTVNISVGLTRMSGTNHQPLSLGNLPRSFW